MRTLILKLLLLFGPTLAVVYGFPFVVLAVSGELTPVSTIVRRQADATTSVLYGPSYSNPVKQLKFSALQYRAPAVAVFGTSRVMQFRARMFREPSAFYNAGGAAATVWDLRPLLDAMPPERQPKVLIVGLDQYLFNANFAEFRAPSPTVEPAWNDIVHNSRWIVYGDLWSRKFTLRALADRHPTTIRLGLNAIANNQGFRNDGSYRYGRFIANPRAPAHDDLDFRDTLRRIAAGTQRFEYGQTVSREAIDEVRAFLKICRSRGIHVVGLLPPFAHTVYARMVDMGDRYRYLHDLPSALTPVFAMNGHTLFDFSDLKSLGASDLETIDGFHASERAYLRIILEMYRRDAVLSPYVADPAMLRLKIETADPYEVFDDDMF